MGRNYSSIPKLQGCNQTWITLCFLIRRDWNPLELNYNLIADTTRRSNLHASKTLQVKLGFAIGKERYCQWNCSMGRVIFYIACYKSIRLVVHLQNRTLKGKQICCDTKVVLRLFNNDLSAVSKFKFFDVRDSIINQYAVKLSSYHILGNHWIGIAYVLKWFAKNINPCSLQLNQDNPSRIQLLYITIKGVNSKRLGIKGNCNLGRPLKLDIFACRNRIGKVIWLTSRFRYLHVGLVKVISAT